MSDDLLIRLNDLADARHDDLDVAAEAATRIISLAWEINDAQKRIESLESENAALREALQSIVDCTPANKHEVWPHHHHYLVTARNALATPTTDKGE